MKKENPVTKCEYCGKILKTQRSINSHICEQMKRQLIKDEKHVSLGFMAFSRFYELCSHKRKSQTYLDFRQSKFFKSFIKFGQYIIDTKVIEPEDFIDFVIRQSIKLTDWPKDSTYDEFVKYQLLNEPAKKGYNRTIETMKKWAIEENKDWISFFNEIEPTYAVKYIQKGEISPWVLFLTDSGLNLLSKFSNEQIDLIEPYINPDLWEVKIKKNRKEVNFIKAQVEKEGF